APESIESEAMEEVATGEATDAEPNVAEEDSGESSEGDVSPEEAARAAEAAQSLQSLTDRIARLTSGVGLHDEDDDAPKDHRGRVFAKLLEAETSVAGRTRWSVGTSRKACVVCQEPLPEDASFHTALLPPSEAVDPNAPSIADASELFERQDYCEPCFEAKPPEHAFAHWKTILPPPPDAPKRIVNLASLRVYFDQLGSIVERSQDSEAAERWELSEEDVRDLERLRYLIALFLVRKRALKWADQVGQKLILECRATETTIEVPIPAPGEAMDAATAAFEQLFG
ncbi:MAG: hypothetical protein AAF488_10070, partial [Planctomycetota bacterium]